MYKVLLLEDDPNDVELVKWRLSGFAGITTVDGREQFWAALQSNRWDAILIDWWLPAFGGDEALERVKHELPDTPVIVISGVMEGTKALEVINAGATSFLPKEYLSLLAPTIERAIKERKAQAEFLRLQRQESVGRLATGITHDLNNLLGHVTLASGVVQRSCSEEHRRVLQKADATMLRAVALVQHILTFSRGEEVNLQGRLDIGAVVGDVINFLRETSPRSVALDIRSVPVPLVRGNQTQVQQVLQNLLVNARDALGTTTGTITVVVDKVDLVDFPVSTSPVPVTGSFVRLSVQDTNGGIPEAILPHIFDSFYTTKVKGSGIGLSTVRSIMASHRGHIDVSTHLGVGTTFTLLFPVVSAAEPTTVAPEVLPQGNGETILIVDDELSVLDIMRQVLESCNYNVLSAGSGSEAFSIYRRTPGIEVVVTDMMMVNLGGVALAGLLRQSNPQAKIVFVSGTDHNPAERLAAKADAFLMKPFSSEALLAILAQLCKQTARPTGNDMASSVMT